MHRLYRIVVQHPLWSIIATFAITAFLAAGLVRLEIKTDGAAIHPTGNPVVTQSQRDQESFFDSPRAILLVSSRPDGPSIRTPEGLRHLSALHDSLASLPGVRRDGLQSLASVVDIGGGPHTVTLSYLLDSVPADPAGFGELTDRIASYPLSEGLLLSADGRSAAVYIPAVVGLDRQVFLDTLEQFISRQGSDLYQLKLTGPLVAETTLGKMVLTDLGWLIPIMLAVIAVLLLTTMRSAGGVVVPMLEAALVLVWTLGLMGWCGVPITLVTTILPVVLMTMAITDEIHLLQRLNWHLAGDPGGGRKPATSTDGVLAALIDVGPPIIATSLTTSVGFLSFLSASMAPVRYFGLFTAFGIMVAMVMSFTLIPALVVKLPRSWFIRTRNRRGVAPKNLLPRHERLATGHSGKAALVILTLVIVAVPGTTRLSVQDSWVDNFDPESDLASAEREFNDRFWGSYRCDVVFGSAEEFFFTPAGADLMEKATGYALDGPGVGGAVSYLVPYRRVLSSLDSLKDIAGLSPGEMADLGTMVEMSTDRASLLQMISADGSMARLMLLVRNPDYQLSKRLLAYLREGLSEIVSDKPVEVHFSGDIPEAVEVVRSITGNQLRSIGWTILGIALLFLLVSPRGLSGLVVLAPVCGATLLVLGVMGYAGLHIGIATSMFASLTIGVGVDFALHVFHHYRRERRTCDHQAALHATFSGTGQAIRWNALVLAVGFMVLSFSALKPDRSLGLLLTAAIVACYLTSVLSLPALLKRLRMVLVISLLALPGHVKADANAKPDRQAASAFAAMQQAEMSFRSQPRAVKIDLTTSYIKRLKADRASAMWGLSNGDVEHSKILYVVTEPERSGGTALMYWDNLDSLTTDSVFLYLPGFKNLSRLKGRAFRLLIPGTSLTYGDARGFVSTDLYSFRYTGEEEIEEKREACRVVAIPRSDSIASDLGLDSMIVVVDQALQLVTDIDYFSGRGQLFKRYQVRGTKQVGNIQLPTDVVVEHLTNGFITKAHYTYWPLTEPPDTAVFSIDRRHGLFLPKLRRVLAPLKLDSLIGGADSTTKRQKR